MPRRQLDMDALLAFVKRAKARDRRPRRTYYRVVWQRVSAGELIGRERRSPWYSVKAEAVAWAADQPRGDWYIETKKVAR